MKNLLPFLLVFVMLAVVSSSFRELTLNPSRFLVARYNDFWLVKLSCTAKGDNCRYEVYDLPYGWVYKNFRLKIPKRDTEVTREFIVHVKIDNRGEQSEKKLNMFMDNGKVSMLVQDIEKAQAEDLVDIAKKNQYKQLVLKDEDDLSWLEKNGIAPFLPSLSYLDKIIASGNSLGITRTFQNIATDKSSCKEKVEYLKDVLEKLNKHISENEDILTNERTNTDHAESEVERLTKQRDKIKEEIKNSKDTNKDAVERQVRDLLAKRSASYTKHYSYSIIAKKYHEKLKIYIGKDSGSYQLSTVQKELSQDEEELKGVEKEMAKLEEKRVELQWKIRANKKKLEDTGKRGNVNPGKISILEKKYKEYNDMAVKHEQDFKKVQRQLEQAKKKLEKSQDNSDHFKERLQNIEQQLKKAKFVKNDRKVMKKVNQLVNLLKRNKPKLEKSMQKCQDSIKKEEETAEREQRKIIYPARIKKVQINDLEDEQIIPLSSFERKYPILQRINIFSTAWVLEYGVPTTSSFLCTVKKKPVSNYGIITAINKSAIRVRDKNGNINALYLGVCTQLEGTKIDFVPDVGDYIDWEGDLVVQGIVNVHNARIYRK